MAVTADMLSMPNSVGIKYFLKSFHTFSVPKSMASRPCAFIVLFLFIGFEGAGFLLQKKLDRMMVLPSHLIQLFLKALR